MGRRVENYKELQLRLRMDGFTNKEIGDHLGRSEDYVARRFRRHDGRSFDIDEGYRILELAGLPKEDFFRYFPPNGKVASGKGVTVW